MFFSVFFFNCISVCFLRRFGNKPYVYQMPVIDWAIRRYDEVC